MPPIEGEKKEEKGKKEGGVKKAAKELEKKISKFFLGKRGKEKDDSKEKVREIAKKVVGRDLNPQEEQNLDNWNKLRDFVKQEAEQEKTERGLTEIKETEIDQNWQIAQAECTDALRLQFYQVWLTANEENRRTLEKWLVSDDPDRDKNLKEEEKEYIEKRINRRLPEAIAGTELVKQAREEAKKNVEQTKKEGLTLTVDAVKATVEEKESKAIDNQLEETAAKMEKSLERIGISPEAAHLMLRQVASLSTDAQMDPQEVMAALTLKNGIPLEYILESAQKAMNIAARFHRVEAVQNLRRGLERVRDAVHKRAELKQDRQEAEKRAAQLTQLKTDALIRSAAKTFPRPAKAERCFKELERQRREKLSYEETGETPEAVKKLQEMDTFSKNPSFTLLTDLEKTGQERKKELQKELAEKLAAAATPEEGRKTPEERRKMKEERRRIKKDYKKQISENDLALAVCEKIEEAFLKNTVEIFASQIQEYQELLKDKRFLTDWQNILTTTMDTYRQTMTITFEENLKELGEQVIKRASAVSPPQAAEIPDWQKQLSVILGREAQKLYPLEKALGEIIPKGLEEQRVFIRDLFYKSILKFSQTPQALEASFEYIRLRTLLGLALPETRKEFDAMLSLWNYNYIITEGTHESTVRGVKTLKGHEAAIFKVPEYAAAWDILEKHCSRDEKNILNVAAKENPEAEDKMYRTYAEELAAEIYKGREITEDDLLLCERFLKQMREFYHLKRGFDFPVDYQGKGYLNGTEKNVGSASYERFKKDVTDADPLLMEYLWGAILMEEWDKKEKRWRPVTTVEINEKDPKKREEKRKQYAQRVGLGVKTNGRVIFSTVDNHKNMREVMLAGRKTVKAGDAQVVDRLTKGEIRFLGRPIDCRVYQLQERVNGKWVTQSEVWRTVWTDPKTGEEKLGQAIKYSNLRAGTWARATELGKNASEATAAWMITKVTAANAFRDWFEKSILAAAVPGGIELTTIAEEQVRTIVAMAGPWGGWLESFYRKKLEAAERGDPFYREPGELFLEDVAEKIAEGWGKAFKDEHFKKKFNPLRWYPNRLYSQILFSLRQVGMIEEEAEKRLKEKFFGPDIGINSRKFKEEMDLLLMPLRMEPYRAILLSGWFMFFLKMLFAQAGVLDEKTISSMFPG